MRPIQDCSWAILKNYLTFLITGCLLASCGSPQQSQYSDNTKPSAPVEDRELAKSESAVFSEESESELDPPVLVPQSEKGEKGARNVLLSFARDIELGRYDEAWSLLGDADQRKWSKAEFASIFSDLHDVSVAVSSGEIEGAAGSTYYRAPVAITGLDPLGRTIVIEGEAILRRVNDIDGASAEQLRWQFQSLSLDWTH